MTSLRITSRERSTNMMSVFFSSVHIFHDKYSIAFYSSNPTDNIVTVII